MLLIDPETANIVDANTAAVSFYGCRYERLTRKKIFDINTLTEEQVFDEIEKAKEIGIRQYIEKPFDKVKLSRLVRKVLDHP